MPSHVISLDVDDVTPKYSAAPFGNLPKFVTKRNKEVIFTEEDRIIQKAGAQDRFVLIGFESVEYYNTEGKRHDKSILMLEDIVMEVSGRV